MRALDDQIREALREALSDECVPLSPNEILHRDTAVSGMKRPRSRRAATIMAVCTAAAGLIAVATVAVVRDEGPDLASAPIEHLPYLLPSSLPNGWTLLQTNQSDQGAPSAFDRSLRAVYSRQEPVGLVQISARPMDDAQFRTSQANELTIPNGVAGWTSVQSDERAGISVEALRGGFLIEAEALGWPMGDESVVGLLDQISIDTAGRPVLDPASGFSLDAISPDPAARVLANYATVYGVAESDDNRLYIQVERLDRPLDIRFSVGVFAEPTQVDDREVWVGDGSHTAVWMAAPDVRVSVFGPGINAADEIARLRDVSASEFTDATGLEPLQ